MMIIMKLLSVSLHLFLLTGNNVVALSNYLDSIRTTTPSSKSNNNNNNGIITLDDVAAMTPEDHYAKNHPGAGWAGYKHPQYGGYLNQLSSNHHEPESSPLNSNCGEEC